MVECNCVKVVKSFKFIIHFGLFIAFVILTALALRDLLSEKTTFHVSQEYKESLVLPSFTACLYPQKFDGMLDESTLASKGPKILSDMNWGQFSLKVKYLDGSENSLDIGKYYNTEKYCKPQTINIKTCVPCLSYSGHELTDKVQNTQV